MGQAFFTVSVSFNRGIYILWSPMRFQSLVEHAVSPGFFVKKYTNY